jgi:hypothetical protein
MSTIPENYAVQEFSEYLVYNFFISDKEIFPSHIYQKYLNHQF